MKVLITGVAGFVGSTLARSLIETGCTVYGVDNLSYGNTARINDLNVSFHFHEVCVSQMHKIFSEKFDFIINCAAVAPLPENEVSHFNSLYNNVAICGALVDFMRDTGSRYLIHFSSGAVYEGLGTDGAPLVETAELNTRLMYPTSKLMSEIYLDKAAKNYGLTIWSLRLFNLYGPRQDYWRKQPPFIGYVIRSILEKKKATVYASESARRDYVYIDDLISLIRLIFGTAHNAPHTPLNVCTGAAYSVFEIIDLLEKVSGETLDVVRGDQSQFWHNYPNLNFPDLLLRKEVEKVAVGSYQRAHELLGWAPNVSLSDGLGDCYTYAKGLFK